MNNDEISHIKEMLKTQIDVAKQITSDLNELKEELAMGLLIIKKEQRKTHRRTFIYIILSVLAISAISYLAIPVVLPFSQGLIDGLSTGIISLTTIFLIDFLWASRITDKAKQDELTESAEFIIEETRELWHEYEENIQNYAKDTEKLELEFISNPNNPTNVVELSNLRDKIIQTRKETHEKGKEMMDKAKGSKRRLNHYADSITRK